MLKQCHHTGLAPGKKAIIVLLNYCICFTYQALFTVSGAKTPEDGVRNVFCYGPPGEVDGTTVFLGNDLLWKFGS